MIDGKEMGPERSFGGQHHIRGLDNDVDFVSLFQAKVFSRGLADVRYQLHSPGSSRVTSIPAATGAKDLIFPRKTF